MKKKALIILLVLIATAFSFIVQNDEKPVPIPPSQQRTGGDAVRGYKYLTEGDYIRTGIPENVFRMAVGKPPVFLQRDSINKDLPHDYSAVRAENGEILIAPNCLQCHAQVFEGKLYIGLGNSFVDFSDRETFSVKNLEKAERFLKTLSPKKYKASADFFEVFKTITPYLYTDVQGVNIADRLGAVLEAHRDPVSLRWLSAPQMEIPKLVIPTDVPPWWLLKKKNAMFYNGFGRGDFGRFLMLANLLTVRDTSEATKVDKHMPDLLAYLYSLEPPKYPYTINDTLAAKGKLLFNENCSKCHGRYDEEAHYPNLLIPQSVIKTDSMVHSANYSHPQFVNWFNNSWFTKGDHPAKLELFKGYIAPPLDGVWITAPYLHNGSVPTIEAVLNSSIRPDFWSRDFEKPEYDYEKLGWKFSRHDKPGGNKIYNTTLPGYSNSGHYFGDKLNDAERKAIIEYLKTL